jgi:hypothetical protein
MPDHNGHAAAKLIARDAARRIAVNIAKLAGISASVLRARDAAGGGDSNDVIVFAAAARAGVYRRLNSENLALGALHGKAQ